MLKLRPGRWQAQARLTDNGRPEGPIRRARRRNSVSDSLLPEAGQSRNLLLDGPAGAIEVLLAAPREPVPPAGCAVICHPHPLHGGELSNKITYTLASCALKAGLYALRFNFRGVGRSAGVHDNGRGETEDTVFLARWLQAQQPDAKLLLAGFSFGAWVSANAAAQLQPSAVISIAPPFAKYFDDAPLPKRPACPWLVIHDTDDDVVDYAESKPLLEAYSPPPQLVTTSGAGHFYHGRLGDLTAEILPFLQQHFAG